MRRDRVDVSGWGAGAGDDWQSRIEAELCKQFLSPIRLRHDLHELQASATRAGQRIDVVNSLEKCGPVDAPVHEAVLGRKMDIANFRKALLDMDLLKEVGEETEVSHRPAKLFRFDEKAYGRFVKRGQRFDV